MTKSLKLSIIMVCVLVPSVVAVAQNSKKSIRGTINVVQTCDKAGKHTDLEYSVYDEWTGETVTVNFKGNGKAKHRLKTGDRVTITGTTDGDALTVLEGVEAGDSVTIEDTEAAADERRVAVIIVNFADSAVACSKESIASTMFPDASGSNANVADYYAETSHGAVYFNPDTNGDGAADVFGPYTISATTNESCNYQDWGFEAEDLAWADGQDLSIYNHLLFVIPSDVNCSWAGVANVGCGTQCRAWVARCYEDIFAHELGHNLSLRHASTDTNNDGVMENTYGDKSDVMGYSRVGWRHVNAPHKDQMGWFSQDPGQIVEVQQSGVYRIAPLGLMPWEAAYPQMLKVAKPNSTESYYFSFRTAIGYDAELRTEYLNNTSVHRYAGGSINTYYITGLGTGQSFGDSNFTATQVAVNTDPWTGYAEVQIDMGCSAAAPTFGISPSSLTTDTPGTTLSYALTVVNNDSGCASSDFSLSASAPSGWAVSFSQNAFTLAPGESTTATVNVSSPVSAGNGSTGFTVVLSSNGHNDRAVSGTYTINMPVTDTPPDPVNTLSASVHRKTRVQLSWSATYNARGESASHYKIYRDSGTGYIHYATSSSTGYTDSGTSSGATYSYYVIAVSSSGLESSPGNVAAVTVGGSDGGGGGNNGKGGGGGSTDDKSGNGGGKKK